MSDPTPFHDLASYVALPRLSGLVLSPDGTRLVTAVATLDRDGSAYRTSLWAVDPSGTTEARRLTRSGEGESAAAFAPDGTLVFTSTRPAPHAPAPAGTDDDPVAALWALPADGGEARLLARRPGGVDAPVTAAHADVVVVSSATMPGAASADEDAARRKARKDAKVTAILHEGYPVRYWDHDLGPDEPHLLVGRDLLGRDAAASEGDDESTVLIDLTPAPGRRHDEGHVAVAPDGSFLLAGIQVPDRDGTRPCIERIDTVSGERTILLVDATGEYVDPVIDPTGTRAVVRHETESTPEEPPRVRLVLVDLADSSTTPLAPGWDRWPGDVAWLPDGDAVVCTADDDGARPVFRIDLADGSVTRLTTDHGSYGDLQVSPDGAVVYALRSAVDAPAEVVSLDSGSPGEPRTLPGPAPRPALPGTLESVETAAEDGTRVRAWLALPHDSAGQPAPLVVWIHGGPLGSWNAWSWRWNPWLAVARGYAVLLPDPALSTGYGLDFIRRGWGRWGEAPYTDLLAVTDAACALPTVDDTRTAAMGGSFGGYMANWVAGHTDRFDAIVTHASLWALDQFGPTTDRADYWRRELTEEMALANSPHRFVADITTPMLVIHGDRDYRVPIGEGLRLWHELARHHAGPDGTMDHKFLYFPDENHWVLKPGHAAVWYETVFAFLAQHVLGQDWVRPDLL